MEETLEKRLGELILQLKSGDISVLTEIDMIVGKRLRAYANIYYLQKADVDDAIQPLLYKLKMASKHFKENKHAYAWVVTVFRNLILSNLKREKRERDFIKQQMDESCLINNESSDEYLNNHVFLKEIMSKLNSAENALVENIFILGLSYSETAKILHKPKSTIEYQIAKLKEKLATMK